MPADDPKPQQPKCTGCNHPLSFHRSGKCRVMGCKCQEWNGPHIVTRIERERQAAIAAALQQPS